MLLSAVAEGGLQGHDQRRTETAPACRWTTAGLAGLRRQVFTRLQLDAEDWNYMSRPIDVDSLRFQAPYHRLRRLPPPQPKDRRILDAPKPKSNPRISG